MIDTRELRLGNIILYNEEPVEVKGVLTDVLFIDGVVRQSDDGLWVEYVPIPISGNVMPLPLNDFLLEQMGRTKIPHNKEMQHLYTCHSSLFTIFKEENEYFIGMNYDGKPMHITPCKFDKLHQLQNVCFAQFGLEIEVDLHVVKMAWQLAKQLNRLPPLM